VIKKVVPQLKDLEFHKEASVRSAAKNLKKRIEAGPEELAFPFTGVLIQGEKRTFPCQMTAGKTYVIDLQSKEFLPASHLNNPAGQQVVGFAFGVSIFSCADSGRYEIIVTSLNQIDSGTFVLNVREQ